MNRLLYFCHHVESKTWQHSRKEECVITALCFVPNIQTYVSPSNLLKLKPTSPKFILLKLIQKGNQKCRYPGSPFNYPATNISNCGLWNPKRAWLLISFLSMFKIRSLTLRLKACRERERGNGTAAGRTRGDTTPRQERSNVITPASATAAGNSVTPSQPVPVDPHPPGRARRLLSSNRSAYVPNSLYTHTHLYGIVYWFVCIYCSHSMAALWLKLAL